MIWVVLDSAIDSGVYDGDEDIKADYQELLRKVALRGNIK